MHKPSHNQEMLLLFVLIFHSCKVPISAMANFLLYRVSKVTQGIQACQETLEDW